MAEYHDAVRSQQEMERFLLQPAKLSDTAVSAADPTSNGDYDALGFPLTDSAGTGVSWGSWVRSCTARAQVGPGALNRWFTDGPPEGLFVSIDRDRHLAAALPATGPHRHPGNLVEARASGVTAMFESSAAIADPRTTHDHIVGAAGLGLRVYDGALYWIPGASAAACLTSTPPDAELMARIRLPFPAILVGFAEPVPLTALEDTGDQYLVVRSPDSGRAMGSGERFLEAVWLTSGSDGTGLGPVAVWFFRYGGDRSDTATTASAGVWAGSAYPGVAPNLAALFSWEQWEQPPDPGASVGEPGSREWRKALKRSATRKAATRGALHGIRVLTIPSIKGSGAQQPPDSQAPRKSPIEHWRRGHWTSVRVATRDAAGAIVGRVDGEKNVDWHYEGRWKRPVLVNVGGGADPGAKVYRLGS